MKGTFLMKVPFLFFYQIFKNEKFNYLQRMASSLTSFLTTSNNIVNLHRATTGNIVTLSATFDTTATTISGTLNGISLTYFRVGLTTTYTATYTVVETDIQGAITLTLTADTVSASATTDSNPVVIDTIPPTSSITYTTSGVSVLKPVIGDIHTLTLNLTEPILYFPKVSFGNIAQSRVDNHIRTHTPKFKWTQVDSFTWTATYTITGNELLPRSLILNLVDLTGNLSILQFSIIETKVLDFANKFYYFDHFINQTQGRFFVSGGGTNTIVSPIAIGESGIIRSDVAATNSYAGYNISTNYSTFLYQSYNYFEATMKISDLSAFTTPENSIVRFGFVDSDATTPVYGIYFESDTTNNRWKTVTALNSTIVANSISSSINVLKTLTLWSKELKIIFTGTQAKYYLDGFLIDTQNYTVPDPIGSSSFPSLGFVIKKTNGSGGHFLKIDYVELYMRNQNFQDFNDDFSGDFN